MVYPHNPPEPIAVDKPFGIAILSGHIYKGKVFPELQNKFIFADLAGSVWYVTLDTNHQVIGTKLIFKLSDPINDMSFLNDQISDISLNYEGEIVISAINSGILYTIGREQKVIFNSTFIIYGSILLFFPILVLFWKKYVTDIIRKTPK